MPLSMAQMISVKIWGMSTERVSTALQLLSLALILLLLLKLMSPTPTFGWVTAYLKYNLYNEPLMLVCLFDLTNLSLLKSVLEFKL